MRIAGIQPDPEEITRLVVARLHAMTPAERRQTLIDSGILTETGGVHERYRHAIVPMEAGERDHADAVERCGG
jgi:hypothetical protein